MYVLKREDGRNLYFTRETLSCMFDLTIVQAGQAMGICHTTAKKMRAWSGLKRWPCCQVVCGSHPQHTLESIQRTRDGFMARASAEGDACMYNVLFAASCIAYRNCEKRQEEANERVQARRTMHVRIRTAKRAAKGTGATDPFVCGLPPADASAAAVEDPAETSTGMDDAMVAAVAEMDDSLFDGLPFFDGLASPLPNRDQGAWLGGWQSSQ